MVFLRFWKGEPYGIHQHFENYLRENGKAEKTIESYTGGVRGFIGFLSLKGITFDGVLNRFAVNSYKNHLLQESYEPTTINKKLNSLQSFNIRFVDSGEMTDMVINLSKDRIKIAKGSEKQVETFSARNQYHNYYIGYLTQPCKISF